MVEIIKKFRFKDKPTIINAPKVLEDQFIELGFKNSLEENNNINLVVCVNNKDEFIAFLTHKLSKIEEDTNFWFAYPKGTSKIKTDINRDILRETAEKFGITAVTLISINETWSALRFRPIDKVGK